MHSYFFQYCFSPFIVNWFIDKSSLMKEPETGNKKTSALFPASNGCLKVNPDLSTLNSEVTHPLHYSFSQKILTEIQSGSNQPDSVHKCNLWEHRPKRTETLPWPQRRRPSRLGGNTRTPLLHRPRSWPERRRPSHLGANTRTPLLHRPRSRPQRRRPSRLGGNTCTPLLHRPRSNTAVRQLNPTKSGFFYGVLSWRISAILSS